MFLSERLRSYTTLFVFPVILIPCWLIAIAGFSTLDILPLGVLLASLASIYFVERIRQGGRDSKIFAEIARKVILYCKVMAFVSRVFVVVKFAIFLAIGHFSPALAALSSCYNKLDAKWIVEIEKHLIFEVRMTLIGFLILSVVFFPMCSGKAASRSRRGGDASHLPFARVSFTPHHLIERFSRAWLCSQGSPSISTLIDYQ